MSRIGGVGVYGVISICLFFAVFVGVLVWTFGLKPSYLKAMRQLPLEDSSLPEPDAGPTLNPGERHD